MSILHENDRRSAGPAIATNDDKKQKPIEYFVIKN